MTFDPPPVPTLVLYKFKRFSLVFRAFSAVFRVVFELPTEYTKSCPIYNRYKKSFFEIVSLILQLRTK